MASFTHVVSRFLVTAGNIVEVYACPEEKTQALVDLHFFKEDLKKDTVLSLAISRKTNPNDLTDLDYFLEDVYLKGSTNTSELSKLIMGPGERLYAKLMKGDTASIRLVGTETSNPAIMVAGRLAAVTTNTLGTNLLYQNSLIGVGYISASMTIYNPSQIDKNVAEIWVTSSSTATLADKVAKVEIPPKRSMIIENLILKPDEQIHVQSNVLLTEYTLIGTVVAEG